MARKTLYDPNTFPLLAESAARKGYTDKQIYESLGISRDAFYNYQKKYKEFHDSIKRGKKPIDIEVENKLLKRALGYEFTEEHREIEIDEQGVPHVKRIKSIKRDVPSDVGAIAFWLKNRNPTFWRDKRELSITAEDFNLENIAIELYKTTEYIFLVGSGREKMDYNKVYKILKETIENIENIINV